MICDQLKSIILSTLTHDFLRYVIGAGGVYVLINVMLAGPMRNRKIRTDSPVWAQMRREILLSLRTVLIFAATGICISLGVELGMMPIYSNIADWGIVWFAFSTGLIIVAHDAWFYWSHRLIHHPHLFRHFHRAHHRSHNPSPFTSYSFDTGEAVLNAIFLPLFVVLVPMHPLALLIFVIHMMLRNALAHCGYEVFPADGRGRPLFGWLSSVTHHDLHHANARYNMGFYFTWWDRLMGTEHPDYAAEFARAAPRLRIQRRGLSTMILLGALMVLAGTQTRAEALRGTYAAPGLAMVVRFVPCPDAPQTTCGKLLWGWDMTRWQHRHPGDLIVEGLVPSGSEWVNGKLINPENGRIYRGSVRRHVDGGLSLSGCAGPFCRRQHWREITPLHRLLTRLDRPDL
jgi:Delta7-sterol 5-desaturase